MNTTINYLQVAEVQISYSIDQAKKRAKISHGQDATNIFRSVFKSFIQHHEEFWIMLLSHNSTVLGIQKISQGGLDATVVDLRIIMQGAILSNAAAIIACHNHPSGNLRTSKDDDIITKKIDEACKLFNIRFLDHIIITDESYYSYVDEGRL